MRLIADLSLTDLAQYIEPLLQAPAADERAASVRALGRLGVQEAQALIQPLLHYPVQEVRKAAQTALRNLGGKETSRANAPSKIVDGARRWTIGETSSSDDDNDWKAACAP